MSVFHHSAIVLGFGDCAAARWPCGALHKRVHPETEVRTPPMSPEPVGGMMDQLVVAPPYSPDGPDGTINCLSGDGLDHELQMLLDSPASREEDAPDELWLGDPKLCDYGSHAGLAFHAMVSTSCADRQSMV